MMDFLEAMPFTSEADGRPGAVLLCWMFGPGWGQFAASCSRGYDEGVGQQYSEGRGVTGERRSPTNAGNGKPLHEQYSIINQGRLGHRSGGVDGRFSALAVPLLLNHGTLSTLWPYSGTVYQCLDHQVPL